MNLGMSSADGISIEEAADTLKLKADQVRDLIAAGALKATGSGAEQRVTQESLMLYMVSRLASDVRKVTERPSRGSVVSGALLPLVLVMWFMAACVEVFSLRDGKPIVPTLIAVPVLAGVLALTWWMARNADDFSSTNGAGTTLYGKRMTPEGRVGTQWLIFAGIPLLPVRSYVILEAGEEKTNWSGAIRNTQYRLRSLGRVYWPQALPILAGVWAGLAGLVALALFS